MFAAALAVAGSALALPEAPSLEAAKPIAKAENRAILMELTGKDWCPGCIYLKTKIFDSEAFDKAVGGKYILVEVDYPRDPKKIEALPEGEWAAREDLYKAYKVGGLPCVIYMDAEGLPYAVFMEYARTPEEYIEKIMSKAEAVRSARDAEFARAAGLEGIEKAKALVAALELLPEVCRIRYTDVIAEIATLDPQNTLGYSTLITDADRRLEQLNAWEKAIAAHFEKQPGSRIDPKNLQQTIDFCEKYLEQDGLLPEVRQLVMVVIADGYGFQRNIPMIYASAVRVVNEMPGTEMTRKYQELIDHYDNMLLDEFGMKEAAHQAAAHYRKAAPEAAPAPEVKAEPSPAPAAEQK